MNAKLTNCLLFAAVAAMPIHAQQIEEVIVTAERHAEDIQTVPVSVGVLSEDRIHAIYEAGADIKAIANTVPGVYAESSNGRIAPRFYIRGLGNTDFDLAASQPVSVVFDDIVLENSVLRSAPVYDIEDVEVSRGPQGTLFGRNTTAGIVKFTTKRPTDKTDGTIAISAGEYATANVEAALGGPIAKGLSYRISGLFQHRDDYIDNRHTGVSDAMGGYNERAGRIQLLYEPDETLSILLNVHGRSLNGTTAIFYANALTKGSNRLNANYDAGSVAFNAGGGNPQKYDGMGTSAKIAYDFGPVTLTAISGFETTHGTSRADVDGGNETGPGVIPYQSETEDGLKFLHQFSQEVHLAANRSDRMFWQAGAYYFSTDYRISSNPFYVTPTAVDQSNVSWALFGQTRYQATERLSLTVGLRWTSDVKAMTAKGPYADITTPIKTAGANVSWDASVDYALSDTVNAYVRAASGFRAPSIQGRNLAFGNGYSTARSETVMSYETGLKTELFDRSLRFNIDAFTYYIHHPQFTAIGGTGDSVKLLNARGGLAYGLEADTEYLPTERLRFTVGASWTKTKIRDKNLKTAYCTYAQCTVADKTDGTGNAYLNNNPFPEAPDYTLSATARYDYPLSNGGALFVFTDWWVQGCTNFFLYRSREFHSNGNYEGGLRAGYVFPDHTHEVALYARNVTNRANLQGAIDFNNLTAFVGDPRVIGIEFKASIR